MAMAAALGMATLASGEDTNEYELKDEVFIVANTIRPSANPTETYHYYTLPFCKPKERQWDDHDLGELLTGNRKIVTDYQVYFGIDVPYGKLCKVSMTPETVKAFSDAIEDDYVFEMYVDNIRLSAMVGQAVQKDAPPGKNVLEQHLNKFAAASTYDYYLNTHVHFDIAYNDADIALGYVDDTEVKSPVPKFVVPSLMHTIYPTVLVLISCRQLGVPVNLSDPSKKEASFTYSVKWRKEAAWTWEDRTVKDPLLPEVLEIHWLSIINSFVLVMLLVAFLSIVMFRILKQDVSSVQVRVISLSIWIYDRYMDPEDGLDINEETGWKLVHADVFRNPPYLVVFCAQNWVWNIVACGLVIPGPLLGVFAFLNTVAIWNDSSAALPFGTIMILICLFLLVNVPLTIIGGIAGRNTT
ncbi:hypothetical protein AaE_001726, partial [Aphanomyces astaci]